MSAAFTMGSVSRFLIDLTNTLRGGCRTLALSVALVALAAIPVGAEGGPDEFGYTWKSDLDAGGPIFSWVDISSVGTEVEGLADDNSVAGIAMGLTFRYYWSDYDTVTIGSNGWIGFSTTTNIAQPFSTIPFPGGSGDNFVAPFLADLIFSATGNPGRVLTWLDSENQRFIISFLEVPFWTANAPGYTGANSFQVVFSAADNSITFQYLDMDDTFNDGPGPADVGAGIENITGNIGLQVFLETMPADGSAIRFIYPDPVTFEVIDPAPLWQLAADNKGIIVATDQAISLPATIWNAGNTDAMSQVDVAGQIQDLGGATISDETLNLASLAAQDETLVAFTPVAVPTPGEYIFSTTTANIEDINPANNTLESEIRVVDSSLSSVDLSFYTASTPNNALIWSNSGGGAGTYFYPPFTHYRVDSVEVYMLGGAATTTSPFGIQILDDDGADGTPGTTLATTTVDTGSYAADSWVFVTIDPAVELTDSGFFVAWIQGGDNGGLGTDSTGPASRHCWEKVSDGPWTEYRRNNNEELLIKATVTVLGVDPEIFSDDFETGDTGDWSDATS